MICIIFKSCFPFLSTDANKGGGGDLSQWKPRDMDTTTDKSNGQVKTKLRKRPRWSVTLTLSIRYTAFLLFANYFLNLNLPNSSQWLIFEMIFKYFEI